MTKEKTHSDTEIFSQRSRPKQLSIHNVPTYDVENTNGTN